MNTRKELNIINNLITLFLGLSIIGTIITFFVMIFGEDSLPFFICLISLLALYFSMVFFRAIIEIYDATVTKNDTQNDILNNMDEDNTNLPK